MALTQERAYRGAKGHWDQYQRWPKGRNPARAELERAHGFDTKHGSHLIRLLRTGLEIVRDGELHVRRPDAADLKAIRAGERTFEDLKAEADRLQEEMTVAAKTSTLRKKPDMEAIDGLLSEVLK